MWSALRRPLSLDPAELSRGPTASLPRRELHHAPAPGLRPGSGNLNRELQEGQWRSLGSLDQGRRRPGLNPEALLAFLPLSLLFFSPLVLGIELRVFTLDSPVFF